MSLKRTLILAAAAALLVSAQSFAEVTPADDALAAGQVKVSENDAAKPVVHKIVPRDTLWGISGKYLSNPFKWPKLWKQNAYIKNPHLIYPGNLVRITEEGIEIVDSSDERAEGLRKVALDENEKTVVLEPAAAAAPTADGEQTQPAARKIEIQKAPGIEDSAIKKSGFISQKELDASGAVIGPEEKRLYANNGDEVFVSFKDKGAVKPGDRFTIFTAGKKIIHPATGKSLGYEIETLGSLTVLKAGGVARARIDSSFREISSGARLRAYSEPVREVEITKPGADISGVIVAALEGKENLNEGDLVFIDKGAKDGLSKGNLMRVYRPISRAADPLDPGKKLKLPPSELGTLVVVDAGEVTSTGILVKSLRPIVWGDRVSTAAAE